jgi:hypothetical protein
MKAPRTNRPWLGQIATLLLCLTLFSPVLAPKLLAQYDEGDFDSLNIGGGNFNVDSYGNVSANGQLSLEGFAISNYEDEIVMLTTTGSIYMQGGGDYGITVSSSNQLSVYGQNYLYLSSGAMFISAARAFPRVWWV